ncbi:MAG: hypothetical protein IV090_09820 [Candidatus Sericytochromatia bacterium]|nr:hypothetical protein [Candidatus Sericytochromatia bacterium]
MARKALPSFSALWEKHEEIYTGVFKAALQRLSEKHLDLSHEDRISEQLCLILNQVCYEISNPEREVPNPIWENPIHPVSEDELTNGRSNKRPDFTCKKVNSFAIDPSEHEISFHIECKRLGSPTSRTWVLNERYVTNGIARFDSAHEYGKRANSGMMVGYIIDMEADQILAEVNQHQKRHLSHNPTLSFNFDGNKVSTAVQNLQRQNVLPQRFRLSHLWVDLKTCA